VGEGSAEGLTAEIRVPDHSSEPSNDLAALNREKARLRKAGAIILAVGLISAGLLYWLRTHDSNLDELRESQARAESRQMQLLYGRSGGITEDLSNALKRPGPQAGLIVAISGIIAAGCFYLGQPIEESDEGTSTDAAK
jgi:hypothetical protein